MSLCNVGAFTVTGGNTCRLLPTMLQRVQPEEREPGNVPPWGVHAENAAFVMRLVVSRIGSLSLRLFCLEPEGEAWLGVVVRQH